MAQRPPLVTPRILALDLSLTETGYYCPECGSGTIATKALRGMERLTFIASELLNHAARSDVVVLEGYAFARPNQAHQLGELGGVARLMLYQTGLPYIEVAPAALKAYATGKGNAKKEDVLAAAIRKLDYTGSNHNESDALWLWHIGQALYHGPDYVLEATEYQLKVMSKLTRVKPRKSCRLCGCTDIASCETDDNASGRCMWVEADLCSACA